MVSTAAIYAGETGMIVGKGIVSGADIVVANITISLVKKLIINDGS